MIKLSDTQAAILEAAARRGDGAILPLPPALKLKGGAVAKVLGALQSRGLIAPADSEGDEPAVLCITFAGREAIDAISADDTTHNTAALDDYPSRGTPADQGAWAVRHDDAMREAAAALDTDTGTGQADEVEQQPTAAAATGADQVKRPAVRAGTKQAQMIALLERPEGATVAEIATLTGWQKHTIRGAIAGALKKRLGLEVNSSRDADGQQIYRIVTA